MTVVQPLPIVFGDPPVCGGVRDRVAAYAVIKNRDGHVAAIGANVRGRNAFWLPGGGMLEGETPEQTVVREVREELGYHVELHQRIAEVTQFFYASDDDCWYKMAAHFFSARLIDVPQDRGEYELQWVDPIRCESDFFHECHVWATQQ